MTRVIVIGTSAGGISALQNLFKNLTAPLKVPIVVVLHLHKETQMNLEMVFGQHYKGPLHEVHDKTELHPGAIYFAPPDYHVLFEDKSTMALTQDSPVHYSRPSIDVTFESAAHIFENEACGVLMTGASGDGALGLKAIKAARGRTYVQSPQEAEAPTMPMAALDLFKPDGVLNIVEIAKALSVFEDKHEVSEK